NPALGSPPDRAHVVGRLPEHHLVGDPVDDIALGELPGDVQLLSEQRPAVSAVRFHAAIPPEVVAVRPGTFIRLPVRRGLESWRTRPGCARSPGRSRG